MVAVFGFVRKGGLFWSEFSNRNGPQAAAAFSFYALLSLFAMTALAGGFLGMVLKGKPELYGRTTKYIGEQAPGLSGLIGEALETFRDLGGTLGLAGLAGLLLAGTKATDSLRLWLAGSWSTRRPTLLKRKIRGLFILLAIAGAMVLGFGIHTLLLFASGRMTLLKIPLSLIGLIGTVALHFFSLAFINDHSLEERPVFPRVWKGALLASLLINPTQPFLTRHCSRQSELSVIYGSLAAAVLAVSIIYYTAYVVFPGTASISSLFDRRRKRGNETVTSGGPRRSNGSPVRRPDEGEAG